MFRVVVLDGVALLSAGGSAVRLRHVGRRLLAGLVARPATGVTVGHLEDIDGVGPSEASVSASAMRLRKHFGAEFLPDATDGVYRLRLPTGSVDAWRLSELAGGGSLGSTSVDELRRLLAEGDIFGGEPLNEMLEQARFKLLNDQRALLARLAREAPGLGAKLGPFLLPHVEREPHNQLFVGLRARALADMGDRRGAAHMLDQLDRRVRETGSELDGDLADMRRELVTSRTPSPDRTVRQRGWMGAHNRPIQLWTHALVQTSDLPSLTLVRAGSGFGKSHLIASVATLAEEAGWVAVTVAGREGSLDGASLLREIDGRASSTLSDSTDGRLDRLRDALVAAGRGGPVLLTVDDAQWLGPDSLELLALLATSALPVRVAVVVAVRDDVDRSAIERVEELATLSVELAPLDESEIAELVLDRHPAAGKLAAESIAGGLTAQSGGVPGIAVLLLPQHLDGTATTTRVHADPLVGIVAGLDDAALRVGRVAAALGNPVRLDLVDAIAGLGKSRLATALAALERRQLLRRESAARYQLRHALVGQAFTTTCPIDEWAEINAEAAQSVADLDRHAHHLYEGLPISDQRETVEALVGSARHRAVSGDPVAACLAYARAEELEPLTEVADAIVWSRSLDLTGFHERADDIRTAHFVDLIDAGESESAFRLTISGQPEAESVDGDPTLLRRLRAIDGAALSPSSAWSLAWHAARHALLAGDGVDGDEIDRVAALARSADQQVHAALLRRHTKWADSPHARLAVLDECRLILHEAHAPTQAEYRVVRCMDSYEAGSLVGADAEIMLLEALAPLEARRQWHVRMLRASLASDRGQHEVAERLRQEAVRISIAAGLTDAEFGQLAPTFTDLMIRRELAQLEAMIDGGSFDADRRTVLVAVGCQVRASIGQTQEAVELAAHVLDLAEREPGITSPFAVALVCEPLGRAEETAALRERAASLLHPLRGGFLMLGAGATTLGPVDRYLAFVAEEAERAELLGEARDAASRSGARRWEAVIERDLFEHTGDSGHRDRYESLRDTLSPGSFASE